MNNLKFTYVVELLNYETMTYKQLKVWRSKMKKFLEEERRFNEGTIFWKEKEVELLQTELHKVRGEMHRRRVMKRKMIEEVLIPDLADVVMKYLHK